MDCLSDPRRYNDISREEPPRRDHPNSGRYSPYLSRLIILPYHRYERADAPLFARIGICRFAGSRKSALCIVLSPTAPETLEC
jgi:hypothetical protein